MKATPADLELWRLTPRRVLGPHRQAVLLPLTYGRARILVGPLDDPGGDVAY